MRLRTQIIAAVSVVIALGIMVLLNFGPSPITGFVAADTYAQQIDATIEKDAAYYLVPADFSSDDEITSLRVSGKVYGTGVVKIFIQEPNGEKYLIYSNEKVKTFNRITGFLVGDTPNVEVEYNPESSENLPFVFTELDSPDSSYIEYERDEEGKLIIETDGITGLVPGTPDKEDISYDVYESIPEDKNRPATSEFSAECFETCAFFSQEHSFKFIFEIEEGTVLQLTELIYTINSEKEPLYDKYE